MSVDGFHTTPVHRSEPTAGFTHRYLKHPKIKPSEPAQYVRLSTIITYVHG